MDSSGGTVMIAISNNGDATWPGSMSSEQRTIVIRLIRDNWLAEAGNLSLRFHTQVCPLRLAPSVRDRAAIANYWADECRHAILFADLLRDFDAEPRDEDYDTIRPTAALNLPITSWSDFALFQIFADTAGVVHLGDYQTCSYLPLRQVASGILQDERRHMALGIANLRASLKTCGARDRIVEILPVWYRASMEFFGHSDSASKRDEQLVALGLRRSLNGELRQIYRNRLNRILRSLDLTGPGMSNES